MMVKHTKPDLALLTLPSLHTIRTFVEAARYQSITRAAETLCVTQASVSRQIRALEEYLETDLFLRSGRTLELTKAGSVLFDAVHLSLGNLSRVTDRIRDKSSSRKTVKISCSPSVSRFFLAPRVSEFLKSNLDMDVDVTILTTHDIFSLDAGIEPDLYIGNWKMLSVGYSLLPLISDVIYPVCSPNYLEQSSPLLSLNDLLDGALISLTPHVRSKVDAHVDWSLWFGYQNIDWGQRQTKIAHLMTNDYGTTIDLALNHQGIALGWNFLVRPLIESGLLVRPVKEYVAMTDTTHFLAMRDDKANDECCLRLHAWLVEQFRVVASSLKM